MKPCSRDISNGQQLLALSCKVVLIGFNNPLLQVCHESHMRWTVINHEHNGGGKHSNNLKIKRKIYTINSTLTFTLQDREFRVYFSRRHSCLRAWLKDIFDSWKWQYCGSIQSHASVPKIKVCLTDYWYKKLDANAEKHSRYKLWKKTNIRP